MIFPPGDEVTISGLAFANFAAASTGSVELDVDNDATGDAVDDRTVTIGPVLNITGTATAGTGQLYTLNLSASGPVTSWTIDWGGWHHRNDCGEPPLGHAHVHANRLHVQHIGFGRL